MGHGSWIQGLLLVLLRVLLLLLLLQLLLLLLLPLLLLLLLLLLLPWIQGTLVMIRRFGALRTCGSAHTSKLVMLARWCACR